MKLKRDAYLTVHLGGLSKTLFVQGGTKLTKGTLRGEEVFYIASGKYVGWYFVASKEWALKNISGVRNGTGMHP